MGKGTIISGGASGQYQVQVNLDRSRSTASIARLNAKIADLNVKWLALPPGSERDRLGLEITSLEKQVSMHTTGVPADPTVSAWCADLTENLSGVVGTIEIPGERGAVAIQPGWNNNAAYNTARDGQLQPSRAATPSGVFWNWAMLPGWQKWKPAYRYGTITEIDGDTCTVLLDNAVSTAQGLNINQGTTLQNVAIEYMECNGAAFAVADEVIVKFQNQSFSSPRVIGFKASPKPCEFWLKILSVDGNPLAVGGQNVRVAYYDTVGDYVATDWDATPTAAQQTAGQTRGLCGPFLLLSPDRTRPMAVEVDSYKWELKFWPDVAGTWREIFTKPRDDAEYFYRLMTTCATLDPADYEQVGDLYRRDYYAQTFQFADLSFSQQDDPVEGVIHVAELTLTLGVLAYEVTQTQYQIVDGVVNYDRWVTYPDDPGNGTSGPFMCFYFFDSCSFPVSTTADGDPDNTGWVKLYFYNNGNGLPFENLPGWYKGWGTKDPSLICKGPVFAYLDESLITFGFSVYWYERTGSLMDNTCSYDVQWIKDMGGGSTWILGYLHEMERVAAPAAWF